MSNHANVQGKKPLILLSNIDLYALQELATLRVAKVTGGAASKLSKM
jgi:hypothetical protein